jgi:hypothetical protein
MEMKSATANMKPAISLVFLADMIFRRIGSLLISMVPLSAPVMRPPAAE